MAKYPASGGGGGSGITALTGDVTAAGTGSVASTVALVGGSTAANIATAEGLANNAASAATINTLVKRDGSGSFSGNIITAAKLSGSGLSSQRLCATDISTNIVSVATFSAWIAGTTNRITIADNGSGGVTISGPQDIAAASSPTFAGLTLTSFAGVLKAATGTVSASTIVNADVSATAAIAVSKLAAPGSSTQFIKGDFSVASSIATSSITAPGSSSTFMRGDFSTTGAVAQSEVTSLVSTLAGKEPSITAGTSAQFWRGDKTFQTLTSVGSGSGVTTADSPSFATVTLSTTPLGLSSGGTGRTTAPTAGIVTSSGSAYSSISGAATTYVRGDATTATLNMNAIGPDVSGGSATTGTIGEIISSKVSTLTNAAASVSYLPLASVSLTAGEWDIYGIAVMFTNGATFSSPFEFETLIGATSGSTTGGTFGYDWVASASPQAGSQSSGMARKRVSISSSQTYYLNIRATYSAGTPQFRGSIEARRMR